MIVVTEPLFDFIINAAGEAMLVMLARAGHPKKPFAVYDRRKTVALFRDANEIVKLTYINRKVLARIKNLPEISIVEMDEESNPVRQYAAKVILDRQLLKKLNKEKQQAIM
jgi:uncharacterized pyridoxamine 5'-phosphate oxidase family protein